MTKPEFQACLDLAMSGADLSFIDTGELMLFDGCAYSDFKPVHVTVPLVAKFLRWQAMYIGRPIGSPPEAGWDHNELNECASIARKKFILIQDFKSAIHVAALKSAS